MDISLHLITAISRNCGRQNAADTKAAQGECPILRCRFSEWKL